MSALVSFLFTTLTFFHRFVSSSDGSQVPLVAGLIICGALLGREICSMPTVGVNRDALFQALGREYSESCVTVHV